MSLRGNGEVFAVTARAVSSLLKERKGETYKHVSSPGILPLTSPMIF